MKVVYNFLTSYINFKLKRTKVAHLHELANESVLNGALVIEIFNNSSSESKINYKAKNVLIEKIEIWAVKNIFPLNFTKYLS